ncbi:MAG: class I SAM-dependent methyltransferase, partial [Marmoricola sp.]|nr:class I SAM-dependent methyltransferase [Marmoricola sp.]
MSTTTTPDLTPELKAKHRAMWAFGDYADVAETVVPEAGRVLVDACDVRRGERVLDIAAGAGNAAIPAAARGAEVVASDLTPELLERGREAARRAGVTLTWDEADAEALPYADGAFDVVLSSLGVMFAPHHQRTADELVRVTRRGGRIGLLSWTPQGFIGQMFATMKAYVPAPPAGVSPPPLWGDPDHV